MADIQELIKSANQGNLEAQCELADLYFYGIGVEKDAKKAIEIWKDAVQKGCAGACPEVAKWHAVSCPTPSLSL